MAGHGTPRLSNAITDIRGNFFSTWHGAREAVKKRNLAKNTLRHWMEMLDDKGIVASTKVGGVLVYTVISDIDVQSSLEQTADWESAAETYANLQKEAETFLSSIVTNLPEKGIGVTPQDWFDHDSHGSENDFRHISVIALSRPGLPWATTVATRDTLDMCQKRSSFWNPNHSIGAKSGPSQHPRDIVIVTFRHREGYVT